MADSIIQSPPKPAKPPSTGTKSSCKHQWLYRLSNGWYCRLCPATAAFMHSGIEGQIVLDDDTTAKMIRVSKGDER